MNDRNTFDYNEEITLEDGKCPNAFQVHAIH